MIANICIAVAAASSGLLVSAWGALAYRLCFAANGISFALLGVAIVVQLKRTPPQQKRTAVRVRPLAPWRPYLDRKFFALPVTQVCIIGFGAVQLEAVMPLLLHDTAGFSTRVVALFLAANGLAVFALQTLVEKYVDRVGEISALQRAVLLWIVSLPVLYVGAQLAGTVGVVIVVLYAILFGLAETLVSPAMQPLVAKSAPEASIGTYAASVSMAYSIGTAIGPALGAWMLGVAGVTGYLSMLAAVLCLPVPLLALHRRVMRGQVTAGGAA
jgi:predicted MFS family arabinose efflux permease